MVETIFNTELGIIGDNDIESQSVPIQQSVVEETVAGKTIVGVPDVVVNFSINPHGNIFDEAHDVLRNDAINNFIPQISAEQGIMTSINHIIFISSHIFGSKTHGSVK